MTSLIDAVLTSDNLDSDLAAAGRHSTPATPRQRPLQRGSSARPGAPPSESVVPQSDDEGFADDQVVGPGINRPKNALDRPVPKVVDEVGMVVQDRFEQFLDT
jgi:DNA replication licensing factor MCM6